MIPLLVKSAPLSPLLFSAPVREPALAKQVSRTVLYHSLGSGDNDRVVGNPTTTTTTTMNPSTQQLLVGVDKQDRPRAIFLYDGACGV